eukprot:GDKJ01038790.1.p1 GENE.GDKJ01038790.1~~GDKJ01038790.1.p1  ORF type:complete len:388 (-),score=106.76 GDKJ01038790.1:1429-2592(-)
MAEAKFSNEAEGYRACVLMKDAKEKLEFLRTLSSRGIIPVGDAESFVGDDISSMIQEQNDLQDQYALLAAKRSGCRGLMKRDELKQIETEMAQVSKNLRETNSRICKVLKDRPNIRENLKKIEDERIKIMELLDKTVQSVMKDLSFNCLVQYLNDLRAQASKFTNVKNEDRDVLRNVRLVQGRFTEKSLEFEQERREGNAAILDLRERVQKTRVQSVLNLQFQESLYAAREENLIRFLAQEEKKYEERVAELELQNSIIKSAYAESRRTLKMQNENLKKRKNIIEKDIDAADTLKSKLGSLKSELEKVQQMTAMSSSQLVAANTAKELDLEREHSRHLSETKKAEQIKMQTDAINLIQLAGRVYMYRKRMRDAGKKKKKGKKGKKKK